MGFDYVLRDVQTEAEETAKHRAWMNANLRVSAFNLLEPEFYI